MTSETPNLHVLKNLNISKTKKYIEKLKTPLRLVWKCCSDAFQIGLTIFRHRGTLNILKGFHVYMYNMKIISKQNIQNTCTVLLRHFPFYFILYKLKYVYSYTS